MQTVGLGFIQKIMSWSWIYYRTSILYKVNLKNKNIYAWQEYQSLFVLPCPVELGQEPFILQLCTSMYCLMKENISLPGTLRNIGFLPW